MCSQKAQSGFPEICPGVLFNGNGISDPSQTGTVATEQELGPLVTGYRHGWGVLGGHTVLGTVAWRGGDVP